MAGSFADYLESALLAHVLGKTTYTGPATVYIALFTAMGTTAQSDANSTLTEVTGGSYARLAITNNTANFPAPTGNSPTQTTLHVAASYTTPTADWGTVIGFGVYDALTVGNLLFWAPLTANQTINNGNTVTWAVDALVVTLD